ncbi:hypothetical protein MJT46_009383, partial [Ovis ammon polii x Ovis aries]
EPGYGRCSFCKLKFLDRIARPGSNLNTSDNIVSLDKYEVEERVILSRRSESRQCLSPDPPAEDRLTQSAVFDNSHNCSLLTQTVTVTFLTLGRTFVNHCVEENIFVGHNYQILNLHGNEAAFQVNENECAAWQLPDSLFHVGMQRNCGLEKQAEQQQQQWQQSSYNTVGRKDYMIFGVKLSPAAAAGAAVRRGAQASYRSASCRRAPAPGLTGFRSGGSWSLERASLVLALGLVTSRHVESSQTRDQTSVSRTGRQIFIHCATREA